jgi:PAS domain S-box-containing protein
VNDHPGAQRPSVVLVDDSEDVRSLVRRRLQVAGFEVVAEGGDGDEAIILAHRHQPALVVLDTSMPRVDGIEALPLVLAVSPSTKVVMFTGFEEPGLVERARELGAAELIEKSIRLEDLPARLLRVLDEGAETSVRRRPSLWVVLDPAARRARSPGGLADPTAQEQAVLSEHVQQFRELFDRAEIGMATLTANGTIVRANRALAGLMACTPQDLVGIDYGRLTGGRGDELDQRLADICSRGEDLTSFEHPLPGPDGLPATRVVRATLAPIRDTKGQVLYVFAQIHDVTAQRAMESTLRRTEDTFRRLVTAVHEYAIYMLDPEGHVVSWNAGAERIKGYEAHEVIGRSFRIFYAPEEQATGHPEHNLATALRRGGFGEEGWRIRKDGSRFWASVVITPVFDDTGRHVGFAKVTRDQSRQREYEEERRRLLDQRIHLLAVTAHELRTPTAVIDGSAGTLQSAWQSISVDERAELLAGIRGSADRLRRLAADLATASRLERETQPPRLEDVSLTEMLRRARARTRATATETPVGLDVSHEATLHVDQERMGQALDNLLDNAIRHGALPIGITATVDDMVRIRVTDGGPGVPPDLVPRLFQRFAMAGVSGGTGLGLYLVREIAREHGGDAAYHPPEGAHPSQFEITLPRRT